MIIFRCIKISFHCNVYVHALSSILTYKQIEFEIVWGGGGGGMYIRVNKPLLINASSKNVVIHVHLCYYNYLKHVQYMYSQERRSIGTGQRPPSQQCPKLQNITTLKFVIIYKGDIWSLEQRLHVQLLESRDLGGENYIA